MMIESSTSGVRLTLPLTCLPSDPCILSCNVEAIVIVFFFPVFKDMPDIEDLHHYSDRLHLTETLITGIHARMKSGCVRCAVEESTSW